MYPEDLDINDLEGTLEWTPPENVSGEVITSLGLMRKDFLFGSVGVESTGHRAEFADPPSGTFKLSRSHRVLPVRQQRYAVYLADASTGGNRLLVNYTGGSEFAGRGMRCAEHTWGQAITLYQRYWNLRRSDLPYALQYSPTELLV